MSETLILTATHGIAPRSDELLRIGGDVERGRLDRSVFDEQLDQESQNWLQLQTDVGIDIKENGKLAWQDHLRPIVKATDGFAPDVDNAPVTRWFETNTFYRKPTIIGPLVFDPELFKAEVGELGDSISLIAPHSFADLCTNKCEEIDRQKNVFQLYAQLIDYFAKQGVQHITLTEFANQRFEEEIIRPTSRIIDDLAKSQPNLRFSYINGREQSLYTFPTYIPSNLGRAVTKDTLERWDRNTRIWGAPRVYGGTFWRGVIDSSTTANQNTTPEPEWLFGLERRQVETVVLTHTVDLQYLALPYAQEKIKRLGEAKEQLKTALGEN